MQDFILDAADTVFFARELEQIKNRTIETLYAPLNYSRLIPIDDTTHPGADTVTYTQYDFTGKAKVISNYADDIPRVDISGKQFTSNIRSIADYYEVTLMELRAAQFTGKPVSDLKAKVALNAHQQTMSDLAFYGDAEKGIVGWLTAPGINKAAVAGNGAAKKFENKTPALMLEDLNEMKTYVMKTTNGALKVDTFVLPISQYCRISNTQYAPGTDTTVLQFFLENSPGITVEMANELQGAFPGGTDGMIAYKKDKSVFWQEIPQFAESFPPQQVKLAYQIFFHSRHGGTIVAQPQSQVFRYGI
jgi:hypothetical protein